MWTEDSVVRDIAEVGGGGGAEEHSGDCKAEITENSGGKNRDIGQNRKYQRCDLTQVSL